MGGSVLRIIVNLGSVSDVSSSLCSEAVGGRDEVCSILGSDVVAIEVEG
jgi:hypothetical protein